MHTIAELAPIIGGVLNIVAAGVGAALSAGGWRRRR